MPSAYTALIENGEVKTGKDFIRACLPHFGIKYTSYCDPKYKFVDGYNELGDKPKWLEETKGEVARLESLTMDQFLQEERRRWYERRERAYALIERYTELNKLYDRVYQDVLNWNVTDDFKYIKDFALDQIKNSRYDGELEIIIKMIKDDPEPTSENIREIYEDILAHEKRTITRYTVEIGKYWEKAQREAAMLQRLEVALESGFGTGEPNEQ